MRVPGSDNNGGIKVNPIAEEYLDRYEGNRTAAILALAADLMKGKPERFQSGYTLDSALLAAAHVIAPEDGDDLAILAYISATAHRLAGFGPSVEGI